VVTDFKRGIMKVLIAGGGTGGHLYPALAIAEALLKADQSIEVKFVGTTKGIESKVVPNTRFPLITIEASGLQRGSSIKVLIENLKFPFRLLGNLKKCISLINEELPDVVVGTGGFVSAPLVLAAQLKGVPTLIQEQNAFPGLATRTLALKANEVHLSFEEAKKALSKKATWFLTGNPSRNFSFTEKQEAKAFFNVAPNRKTLLVFGGSLGARAINQAIIKWVGPISEKYNLIWQTGKLDYGGIRKEVQNTEHIWVNDYIQRMDMAYSAADLVLCRAGASTIAELCNIGKPAIMVPYPYATDNHQFFNAKSLADKQAGILIENKNVGTDETFQTIMNLLENEALLESMSQEALKLGKPNAAKDIAQRIIKLGQK